MTQRRDHIINILAKKYYEFLCCLKYNESVNFNF